jgi:hypothetical protein
MWIVTLAVPALFMAATGGFFNLVVVRKTLISTREAFRANRT